MIRRTAALLVLIAGLAAPAAAQESVTVGLTRAVANGALFLAASRGYFKAAGLDVEMRALPSGDAVAQAVAGGALDFGVADFTATVFTLAGKGALTAVAAQARERHGYEGNAVIASNAAYAKGLTGFAGLANKKVALDALGAPAHYQLGEIALVKGFALDGVILKPLPSADAIARAVRDGAVDAAILPAAYARDIMTASQGKFVGWCSELAEPQLGALFANADVVGKRRAVVQNFVRAYRRGVADYAAALLRHDRYGKRVADAKADAAAALIAAYVYPGAAGGARAVEAGAPFVDPRARLDVGDLVRQIAWYKAQGLIGRTVDAQKTVDLSFTAGP